MNRRERRTAGKSLSSDGSAPLRQALALYQSGKLAEAERAYRAILARTPRDAAALYQLGILLGQSGRMPEAERCLAEACAIEPTAPALHHGLGLLLGLQGRYREALVCHDKALAIDAGHVPALAGRAEALHELGDLAAAESAYQRAAALAPRAPEIRFGWATVLADLGRLAEAAAQYRELLTLDPTSAEAHVNLGTVLRGLGRLEDAASAFRRALGLKPGIPQAAIGLVTALSALGRQGEALDAALDAMRRDPAAADAQQAFSLAVARGMSLDYSAEICGFLERCLEADGLDREDLARAAAWQLRQRHGIDGSAEAAARRAIDEAPAAGCLADPLLHRVLAGAINTGVALEAFLTEVRRLLCLAADVPSGLEGFLAALALQGFNNAYVFSVRPDEEARVAELKHELSAALRAGAAIDSGLERTLLRLALYEPLSALPGAETLLRANIGARSALRAVIERTLSEPFEEAALAREIPALGTIENAVSRAVQEQYEANPYPRWFALPRPRPTSLAALVRRQFPDLPAISLPSGPVEILVAGGGTGRQPITTALAVPEAQVLAVDLSRASLAYAARMARRFNATNLRFLQCDLLALGGLGRSFVLIEAVGVLHHMEDPMAGWRVLCALLRPGGLMRIGLYSALARADVVAAREQIAALGLEPTPRDIRAFRQRVLFGEDAGRLPQLPVSKDMFDLNGCRDLLFHAKEHRYTLPELADMMAALGLEFLGFEFTAPETPHRYRAANPGDPGLRDLAAWSRYEQDNPETFGGMYTFWCRRPPA